MADLKTFELEDADGKLWEVQAPDLDQAVAAFKQMAGDKAVKQQVPASILPWTRNMETGENTFDPTVGLLGSILSGVTAPGDVVSGKLDPNSPEGMQRAMDTTGLMLGVNPMVASGERAIPGVAKNLRPGKPEIPTAQALKDAATAGYQRAGEMGVDYSTVAVKSLVDDLQRQLEGEGFRENLAPGTFSLLKELQAPPADSVMDLLGLTAARKSFGHVAGNFNNKTDQKAATKSIRALDKLLEEPSPESVVAGPAAAAGATIKDANANYAAAMRSEKVTGAAKQAELDASVAGSGFNLDNRTRQLLKQIVSKPKQARGYSPEELALLEEIARGKFGTNLARWAGNFLGGGGGLGAATAAGFAGLGGYALGGPVAGGGAATAGAVLAPILGASSRKLATNLTKKQVGKLDDLIRMRSPLYQQAVENPPMNAVHPAIQDIISRALLLQATGQETQ
jgi:hypothetical protein